MPANLLNKLKYTEHKLNTFAVWTVSAGLTLIVLVKEANVCLSTFSSVPNQQQPPYGHYYINYAWLCTLQPVKIKKEKRFARRVWNILPTRQHPRHFKVRTRLSLYCFQVSGFPVIAQMILLLSTSFPYTPSFYIIWIAGNNNCLSYRQIKITLTLLF